MQSKTIETLSYRYKNLTFTLDYRETGVIILNVTDNEKHWNSNYETRKSVRTPDEINSLLHSIREICVERDLDELDLIYRSNHWKDYLSSNQELF